MKTEVKKITISEDPEDFCERIKLECNNLGNIGYHLVSSFVLADALLLIFQKQE